MDLRRKKYVFKAPTFQFDYFMVVLCFVSRNYTFLLLPAFFFDFIFFSLCKPPRFFSSFLLSLASCVEIFRLPCAVRSAEKPGAVSATEHAPDEMARWSSARARR